MKPILRTLGALALLVPVLVQAQTARSGPAPIPDVRRIGGGAALIAYVDGPEMLTATPKWWRDSVFAAFVTMVPTIDEPLNAQLLPGARFTLALRIKRNGDLHRARLEGSSGSRTVDSLLLAAAHAADEALRYPALPATVEGGGADLRILIATPVPQVRGIDPRMRTFTVAPPTEACRDSLARPTSYRDTPLQVRIDSVTGGARATAWVALVAQALAEHWDSLLSIRPKEPLTLYRDGTGPQNGSVIVDGSIRLRFDGTGRLLEAGIPLTTNYPELDTALMAAARAAEAARSFPPPPSTVGDTATLELAVEELGSTVPAGIRLGKVQLAVWTPTPPAPQRIGRVRYPADLRARGVRGRVQLEFLVGPDGIPVPGSLNFLSSPDPGFIPAVRDMIEGSRFTPGTIRGCPVPMVVRQGVNFQP